MAAGLRWALPESLGPTPFLAFYMAWVAAAAFGGFGPGLLAIVASWLCVDWFFDPANTLINFSNPATAGRLIVLLGGGIGVSLTAAMMRRARSEERRRAEQVALAKQEWERTFDAMPDLVAIIDQECRILQVNRAMAERLGMNADECVGQICYRCMHNLDRPPSHCPHAQTLADGEAHTDEVYEKQLGRHFLVSTTPLNDPQGHRIGIVEVAHDITDRKQAQEALQESHARLKKVLEVETVGVIFWDLTTGRMTDANDAFLKMMGYSHRDVEAGELTWQKLTPPEFVDVSMAEIRRFQATGRVGPYEKEYLRKDGTRQWLLFAGSSLGGNACVEFCVDIADRKRAEAALRQSEERFRVAQELSPDGFLIFRPLRDDTGAVTDFMWMYENDAAARMNDTHPEEVRGKRVSEVLPHHDESPFGRAYREVARTGEVRVVEEALYDQDTFHRRRWFRVVAVPTAGGDVAVLVQDVTERKQAEETLRESQEQFHAMANAIPQLAWIARADGYIYWYNQRWYEYTGATPEQMEGWGWQSVHDPQELPRVLERWTSSIATGRPFDMTFPLRGADGVFRPFLTRIMPLKDEQGRVRQWFGTNTDITEQKRAEESLRETRDYLDSLFGYANAPIIVWDRQYRITRFNRAFERLTGRAVNDVLGRPIDILFPPESREESLTRIYETTEGQRLEVVEIPILGAGGEVRTVLWNSANVLAPDHNTIVATIAQGHDITERKRVEEELRGLTRTLESKVAQRTASLERRSKQLQRLAIELSDAEDKERRRLAEILHDDLQQLLAGAKFHLSLLRKRLKHDGELLGTAVRIDRILGEAVEKSRSLSHQLRPGVLSHGSLSEVFEWLAGQMQAKRGLAVHVETIGENADTQVDAIKSFLFKAAQELLFNVVKHAQVKEAWIRVRRIGRHVNLEVRDRGRGFDPQAMKDTAGFGLSTVRERAETLGGRMHIRSHPGKGSRFRIVVPDRRKTEGTKGGVREKTKRAESPVRASADASSKGALRVLLADDQKIVREGLVSLLSEDTGIEVVGEAGNGREAVELTDRLQPDVVVMDVSMPEVDGEEATRQIKAHLPQTRVVALSMHEEPFVAEQMQRAGAETYVVKTAPSEELFAAIHGNTVNRGQ
jgi:PAS domain S-box-containing protein